MKNFLTVSALVVLTACGGGGGGELPESSANDTPNANPGGLQNTVTGTTVTLDGSGSSDANGDALTYSWTIVSKPAGSAASLINPASPKPTFQADVAGTYVASLVVNDGKISSQAGTVTVTAAVANAVPVANAGTAQNTIAGTLVTLDGSASSDANGDALTYSWTIVSKPAGSAASLIPPTSPKPTLNADVAGTYVASLVVNDGKVSSQAGTVTVTATVANAAPVANAGTAQNAVTGTTVTLDGSGSSDANGDALSYYWTLTSKPAGSSAALSSTTSVKPTFNADVSGTYVASLVVNDKKTNSAASTTTVTASSEISPLPIGIGTLAQDFVNSSKFFKLNESTGLLTELPRACQNFSAADIGPDGMVFAISSYFDAPVKKIDVLTGVCSLLFRAPEPMDAIAISPNGTIVTISSAKYYGSKQVYRFNPDGNMIGKVAASGSSGIVGVGNFGSPGAIDFAPDGSLYAVELGNIWLLNEVTGLATLKAVGLAGTGDIDIDGNGILRTIDFGVLKTISTANWKQTGSKILERDIFGFSPLIHR